MPWSPLAVLPNIRLADPIEAAPLALVPFEDARVAEMRAAHENLEVFLTRFTTQHEMPVEPAILIRNHEGENGQYSTEAMVAFRNCISVATTLRSHALYQNYGNQHRIMYSDTFEFYPWMLDRHFEYLINQTPAQMALHQVEEFHGQSDPGLPSQELSTHDIDRTLLAALLNVWTVAYQQRRQSPMQQALFRSLNMANAALAMPATTGALIFDYGRQCALWISAFEILAHHHAGRGRADFDAVQQLLETRQFLSRRTRRRSYRITYRGNTSNVMLPVKLYRLLYQARNDFLHGNAVTLKNLLIPRNQRFVGDFASLLYRCALRNYLELGPAPPDVNAAAAADDPEPYAQIEVEHALMQALRAPEPGG
jgi:hypothetical protein